jgi:hypothetical protein
MIASVGGSVTARRGNVLTVFFVCQANVAVLVEDRENRPIDVDSR